MKNYFVSGIGTNVGKTIVSAILTEALSADYWKPIQSGTIEGTDKESVRSLVSNTMSVFHPEAYLLKEPASPHLAAKLEDVKIEKRNIQLPYTSNKMIIEGAGGLLVPINEKEYVIELAQQFNASVILVVSSYLGCINHSLLSIDYLLNHNYKIHGLMLNGDFQADVKSAIINYKNIPVLAEIPFSKSANKEFISEQASKLNIYLF
ncbi:MAG TPA: dethiobiotin synthase [Bacteroidia bacterium]|nr:dethiobiotin synthase [Bacteroidia bacterium]HRD38963.1 dethiobiotin synthase [Bacteroidia bacterium]